MNQNNNHPLFKHGMRKTRLYGIYTNMRSRCTNNKCGSWAVYGGRGIGLEWASFLAFYQDMGESYFEHVAQFGIKNTTLDRIDSNKNYCKENCRWATCAQQSRNTSQNRWITYAGQTKVLADWAKEYKIKRLTLKRRIDVAGMSIELALTMPVRVQKPYVRNNSCQS